MIWATVSSRSCFCWLYRVSPSLAAKNIINLISVLTIWWCLCVESSLVLLEEGVCYNQWVLLEKFCYLCPASFCIPGPNLHVIPGIRSYQSNAQNSPSQASTVHELWTSRFSSWIQKRQRNQRLNCQHLLDHQKSKKIPEKHLLLPHWLH